MNIRIASDSSCDLFELAGIDFISVPLTVRTDDKEYVDDPKLDVGGMVEELLKHKGRSYTSCPSPADWESAFEGADKICVFTITKGLSGSFNSAHSAREAHLARYPEKEIVIIDTLSAGPEITLGVWKMQELLLAGRDFKEACRETQEYFRNTALLFNLQSVHNFAQNGRISKLAASASGLLGIQVLGKASTEGTLEIIAKIRGSAKAYSELVGRMLEMGYKGGRVLIGHVMNEKGVEAVKNSILSAFPQADIRSHAMGGLCSYYAEKGGILVGFEKEPVTA